MQGATPQHDINMGFNRLRVHRAFLLLGWDSGRTRNNRIEEATTEPLFQLISRLILLKGVYRSKNRCDCFVYGKNQKVARRLSLCAMRGWREIHPLYLNEKSKPSTNIFIWNKDCSCLLTGTFNFIQITPRLVGTEIGYVNSYNVISIIRARSHLFYQAKWLLQDVGRIFESKSLRVQHENKTWDSYYVTPVSPPSHGASLVGVGHSICCSHSKGGFWDLP